MNYLGVDLGGRAVTLVEASYDPRDDGDPVRVTRTPPSPDLGVPEGETPWGRLREAIRIGTDAVTDDNTDTDPSGGDDSPTLRRLSSMLQTYRSLLAEEIAPASDSRTPVAVVYPYLTPPVLRRHLPLLFGGRRVPVGGGATEPPLFGLEAPAALAVELVARRACPTPAGLLLVTGEGPSRELSAVSVDIPTTVADEATLRVTVRVALPAESPADLAAARDGLRPAAGAPVDWRAWWFASASPGGDDVASALGVPDGRRLHPAEPALAPALGAVRYAGLRPSAGQHLMLGRVAHDVVVGSPYHPSLGVVGVNRDGRRYWHRLFAPGDDLPTPRVHVHSGREGPRDRDHLVLAACLSPAHAPRRWLARGEFHAARLTLHEVIRATRTRSSPAPDRHTWGFKHDARDSSVPWGFPRWSVAYQEPSV